MVGPWTSHSHNMRQDSETQKKGLSSLLSWKLIKVIERSFSLIICHKKYKRENKKKSDYLDSHGEEAQKEPGLIENGLPQINN